MIMILSIIVDLLVNDCLLLITITASMYIHTVKLYYVEKEPLHSYHNIASRGS